MTEANTEIIPDKPLEPDTNAAPVADKQTDAPNPAAAAKPVSEPAKEFVADSTKSDAENDAARAEFDKAGKDDKGGLPEDWREIAAGKDEEALKLLKRHGSLSSLARKLVEQDKMIRSGKFKLPMPDPKDEKAMAEWRKAEGIPEEPTGYTIPDTVKKIMTDADKPMLSSFTEFAHAKGAPQSVIDVGAEWYFNVAEKMAEDQAASDAEAKETAEDTLRKDWAGPEYKSNLTLAKRFIEGIPGVGEHWTEARLPDGRLLGSVPEFVAWASDQGRNTFGDVTFATGDSERKHTARKAEIEAIIGTDEYYEKGLDKEYAAILEKEVARKR